MTARPRKTVGVDHVRTVSREAEWAVVSELTLSGSCDGHDHLADRRGRDQVPFEARLLGQWLSDADMKSNGNALGSITMANYSRKILVRRG